MSSHENYYVPAQSKWPIIATLGMLISVYGVGTWFNDMKAERADGALAGLEAAGHAGAASLLMRGHLPDDPRAEGMDGQTDTLVVTLDF